MAPSRRCGIARAIMVSLLLSLAPAAAWTEAQEVPAAPRPSSADSEALESIEASTTEELKALKEESQTATEGETISEEEYQDLSEDAVPVDPKVDPMKRLLDPRGYELTWNQGIRLQRNDGAFRGKLGARLEVDFASIHGDPGIASEIGGLGNFWEVRRAWITLSGTIGQRFLYKGQVDVTGNSEGDDNRNPYIRDMYLAMTGLGPFGTVKFGYIREPFSIGDLTSSLALSFMERPLAEVFAPAYNMGLTSENQAFGGRLAWSYGLFRFSGVDTDSQRLDLTGRISGLPLYRDDGEGLVHVGAFYSHQFRDEFEQRYRRRPESHPAERFLDTLVFVVDDVDLFGLELATVQGSFMAQTEFIGSRTSRPGGSGEFFWSGYVQVSYFLTGERWPYRRNRGVFGRVNPLNNFRFRGGGWGGFELAARYSYADLNSGDIRGGILSDTTLALNWYLRPHVRVQTNYIHAHLNGVGAANIFQMRFQIDY